MTAAPRVLLMRLSCRTSARGNEYLTGYLGLSRVVAFKAKEPDKFGNEQWEVFVSEPEPKRDQAPRQEVLPPPKRAPSDWGRDLPVVGETRVHRNERRDPRRERTEELAARFDERGDDEVPW